MRDSLFQKNNKITIFAMSLLLGMGFLSFYEKTPDFEYNEDFTVFNEKVSPILKDINIDYKIEKDKVILDKDFFKKMKNENPEAIYFSGTLNSKNKFNDTDILVSYQYPKHTAYFSSKENDKYKKTYLSYAYDQVNDLYYFDEIVSYQYKEKGATPYLFQFSDNHEADTSYSEIEMRKEPIVLTQYSYNSKTFKDSDELNDIQTTNSILKFILPLFAGIIYFLFLALDFISVNVRGKIVLIRNDWHNLFYFRYKNKNKASVRQVNVNNHFDNAIKKHNEKQKIDNNPLDNKLISVKNHIIKND